MLWSISPFLGRQKGGIPMPFEWCEYLLALLFAFLANVAGPFPL